MTHSLQLTARGCFDGRHWARLPQVGVVGFLLFCCAVVTVCGVVAGRWRRAAARRSREGIGVSSMSVPSSPDPYEQGNAKFRNGEYREAIKLYTQAIGDDHATDTGGENERSDSAPPSKCAPVLFLNRAACSLKVIEELDKEMRDEISGLYRAVPVQRGQGEDDAVRVEEVEEGSAGGKEGEDGEGELREGSGDGKEGEKGAEEHSNEPEGVECQDDTSGPATPVIETAKERVRLLHTVVGDCMHFIRHSYKVASEKGNPTRWAGKGAM